MRTVEWKESIILGGPKPRRSIHKMKGKKENNLKDGIRHEYIDECASLEDILNDSYIDNSEDSDAVYEKTPQKTPQKIAPKTPDSLKKSSNETLQSVLTSVLIGLISFLIIGCFVDFGSEIPPLDVSREETRHEKTLKNNIKNIRKEFPSQVGDVWPTFTAGIRKIQEEPTKPSVFLLLHEAEEQTPACLAWKVGKVALSFLNATVQKPLILDGTDIEHDGSLLEDYGKLIDDNRHKVEESHIMIVYNLHKIPAVVAQSFHSFCDTVTPLVDKALYFFIMKAPGANRASDTPTQLAERELKRLWSNDLDIDILTPLIARITDITMVVKPESDISSSCQRR